MKRILITGANSYIGTSFEKYIAQWPDQYHVDTVNMIGDEWREYSFAGYDVIFHVAGIAHQRESPQNKSLFMQVNRDLVLETARKAQLEGVPQFIFLSTMSVYGLRKGVITPVTPVNPTSLYGQSKLQAEEGIRALESDKFCVVILRPPMVYGFGCKGNFNTIVSIVRILPIFPAVSNVRSMVYIDTLCAHVHRIIERGDRGHFFPQNAQYVQTSRVAALIADAIGKKMYMSRLAGLLIEWMLPFVPMLQKAFGSLAYQGMEVVDADCEPCGFEESVRRCVNGERVRK